VFPSWIEPSAAFGSSISTTVALSCVSTKRVAKAEACAGRKAWQRQIVGGWG
jgi:hypothetical protein